MESIPYEIERKYLISRPDETWLASVAERSEIVQTYLVEPEGGGRARVRMRSRGGETIYTHTVKRRLNALRAEEWERKIDETEYQRLLSLADPERKTLCKTRYCLPYQGKTFEIDLYPFSKDRAVMEIELSREDEPIVLPPGIEVIREVSGDRGYSNAALAKTLTMP